MTPSEYLVAQPVITRRIFAVLLLLVVVAIAWQAVVLPLGKLVLSQDKWRAAATQELGFNRGVLATEREAREQLQALRTTSTWRGLFQDSSLGPSDELKAEVANALSTVGAANVRLTSLPADDERGLRRYGLRVVATVDSGQLKRLLETLRARSHYLRIEQLVLTAPILQSPDSNPPLQLKADIFGYSKLPAPRAVK